VVLSSRLHSLLRFRICILTDSAFRKLAGFQKKFFWFGTDAIEVKSLSNYLRGEKPEVGNHNAAWSSQTGKGLLYFSKHATEKTSPVGIINLVSYIVYGV